MEECNNPQFFPTFDDNGILLNTTKCSKPTYPEKQNLSILIMVLTSNCPVCPNAFMLARSLWNCRQNNPSKHYNKPTCLHAAEILGCEEIQDLSEELEAVLHVSLD